MDKEKKKEYDRKRYLQNKEAILARNKKWNDQNKEHLKEYMRNYYMRKKFEGLEL